MRSSSSAPWRVQMPACQLCNSPHHTTVALQDGSVAAQVQAHAQQGKGKLTLRMSTGRWCGLQLETVSVLSWLIQAVFHGFETMALVYSAPRPLA